MASNDSDQDPVPSTSYQDVPPTSNASGAAPVDVETISIHSDTTYHSDDDDDDVDNGDNASDLDLGGEFDQYFLLLI